MSNVCYELIFMDEQEYNVRINSTGSEIKMLGLLLCLPTNYVCVKMSKLTSLCLHFLLCKENIIFVLTLKVIAI